MGRVLHRKSLFYSFQACSMADPVVTLVTLAILLVGLLLDEVDCSSSLSVLNMKNKLATNLYKVKEDSKNSPWEGTFHRAPNENKFPLNLISSKKEQSKINLERTRPLQQVSNVPDKTDVLKTGRKFEPFLTHPESGSRQFRAERLSPSSGSFGTDVTWVRSLSTRESADRPAIEDTQEISGQSRNALTKSTHTYDNGSVPPSYTNDRISQEIEESNKASKNSSYPYRSNHHPEVTFPGGANLNDFVKHNRLIRQLRTADRNRRYRYLRIAKAANGGVKANGLQQPQSKVLSELENSEGSLAENGLPFAHNRRFILDLPSRIGEDSKVAASTSRLDSNESKIHPQGDRGNLLTRTNVTFQGFDLPSTSRHTTLPNTTISSQSEVFSTLERDKHRHAVHSSSHVSSSVNAMPPLIRRLRRRRWGQRPGRTRGRTPTFGRSRSRTRIAIRARASPDAQPVALKVIVEIRVNRGYQRILESAVEKVLRQIDFLPMLQVVNPSASLVRLRHDQPRNILKAFCSEILEVNTTAVFQLINPFYHIRSWSAAQYMSNLLASLNIPVITWGPEYIGSTDKTKSDQIQLNISPTLYHQAHAMLDVLTYFQWSSFAIVYTAVPGHDTFLSAVRVLAKVKERQKHKTHADFKFALLDEVKVSNVSDPASILNDMKELARTEARIVILYCRDGETLSILQEAKKLGLVDREYVWLLTFEALNKNERQNANQLPLGLLGLQYTYRERAMKEAIETAVSLWLRGLQQSVASSAIDSTGSPQGLPWTVPSVHCQSSDELFWKDGKKFYNFLKNVTYDDVSFNRNGQLENTEISLFNVQRDHDDETRKTWTKVGEWTSDGISIQTITWPGGGRAPPKGKPARHYLRVVTREEPPFVIYRNLNSNRSCDAFSSPCTVYDRDQNETRLSNVTVTKCCTGLSIDLLRKLSSALDFDFYLYEVEDFQWGTKTKSGQWDGIVGEVRSGRADMAVASMTIDEDKSTAVNFSVPYMETGITFMVSIRRGAISATAFLEPYDYASWCLILLCSVHVTGASIFLFEWISPNGLDYGHRMSSKYRFSLFRSFWLMWAMLFGAAVSTDSPRGVSSKFTTNIWALFALVFMASYTANLAAFMITKEEYYNLSGMQDWRLQNPYSLKPPFRFGTVPNSTAESNIKKNNPSMYEYMKQYSQLSVDQAMGALKEQRLAAFIYDASVLEYQEGRDKDCKLITVGNWYATTGYGVAFPPGSHWLGLVNEVILELHYEGEMERLKEFWLAGACHTKRKKATNSRGIGNGVSSTKLGILNFTSAFIFLAAGTGLAAIVFVMEHCLFWIGRKKLSNWDKKGCCALISLSMGMSMSFRDSVREAMEAHKKAKASKCKSAICETRLWKVNFELRQAKEQIENLQMTLLTLKSETNASPLDNSESICIANRAQNEVSEDLVMCPTDHSNCQEVTDGDEDEEHSVRVTLL